VPGTVCGRIVGPTIGKPRLPVGDLSTNRSRRDFLEGLGVRPLRTVPRTDDIRDGLQAMRAVLPACWFDAGKCAAGLADLRLYRRDWDPRRATWRDTPRHDAASHAADAFRTCAEGWRETPRAAWPSHAGLDYDPLRPDLGPTGQR
jgi:phage terminase large subunit